MNEIFKKRILLAITFIFSFFSTPTMGVQRFIIDTDELQGYSTTKNHKPLKITPGTLNWNGMRIDPIRSYNSPNLIEYICAQENTLGPELLRGQSITLSIKTNYSSSSWEESSSCDKCVVGCVAVACCPISIPLFCCSGFWKQQDRNKISESIGQIEFQTSKQPQTVRIRLSQNSIHNLVISPEEEK